MCNVLITCLFPLECKLHDSRGLVCLFCFRCDILAAKTASSTRTPTNVNENYTSLALKCLGFGVGSIWVQMPAIY